MAGYCLQISVRHRSSWVPKPSRNSCKRGMGQQEGMGRDAVWKEEGGM